MSMRPDLGSSSPAAARIVVVFTHPNGPRSASNSSPLIERSRLSTATDRPLASISASGRTYPSRMAREPQKSFRCKHDADRQEGEQCQEGRRRPIVGHQLDVCQHVDERRPDSRAGKKQRLRDLAEVCKDPQDERGQLVASEPEGGTLENSSSDTPGYRFNGTVPARRPTDLHSVCYPTRFPRAISLSSVPPSGRRADDRSRQEHVHCC